MKCKVYKNGNSGHEEYFIRMSNNGRVTSGIAVHKIGAKWKVLFSSQLTTAEISKNDSAFTEVAELDLQELISSAVATAVAPKTTKPTKTAKAKPAAKAKTETNKKAETSAHLQIRSGKWRRDPVTDRQLELIADLQEFSEIPIPEFTGTTKGEASDYIDKYIGVAHITYRNIEHADNFGDRI